MFIDLPVNLLKNRNIATLNHRKFTFFYLTLKIYENTKKEVIKTWKELFVLKLIEI